eukprot:8299785-Karenia_brevis.AAC.1
MGGMKQEVASVKSQMSSVQNTMKDMQQSQNAGFERLAQMIGGGSRPNTPRPNVTPAGAKDDDNTNDDVIDRAAAEMFAA